MVSLIVLSRTIIVDRPLWVAPVCYLGVDIHIFAIIVRDFHTVIYPLMGLMKRSSADWLVSDGRLVESLLSGLLSQRGS